MTKTHLPRNWRLSCRNPRQESTAFRIPAICNSTMCGSCPRALPCCTTTTPSRYNQAGNQKRRRSVEVRPEQFAETTGHSRVQSTRESLVGDRVIGWDSDMQGGLCDVMEVSGAVPVISMSHTKTAIVEAADIELCLTSFASRCLRREGSSEIVSAPESKPSKHGPSSKAAAACPRYFFAVAVEARQMSNWCLPCAVLNKRRAGVRTSELSRQSRQTDSGHSKLCRPLSCQVLLNSFISWLRYSGTGSHFTSPVSRPCLTCHSLCLHYSQL